MRMLNMLLKQGHKAFYLGSLIHNAKFHRFLAALDMPTFSIMKQPFCSCGGGTDGLSQLLQTQVGACFGSWHCMVWHAKLYVINLHQYAFGPGDWYAGGDLYGPPGEPGPLDGDC